MWIDGRAIKYFFNIEARSSITLIYIDNFHHEQATLSDFIVPNIWIQISNTF